jgi:hypothetical protein
MSFLDFWAKRYPILCTSWLSKPVAGVIAHGHRLVEFPGRSKSAKERDSHFRRFEIRLHLRQLLDEWAIRRTEFSFEAAESMGSKGDKRPTRLRDKLARGFPPPFIMRTLPGESAPTGYPPRKRSGENRGHTDCTKLLPTKM